MLMQHVLAKALMNRKQAPGLVLVQRQVIRNGKMHTQGFWVTPDEAKVMTEAQTKHGAFDYDKFKDLLTAKKRQEALEYLKDHKIDWDEVSHSQQNWLKAMAAVMNFVNSFNSSPVTTQATVSSSKHTPAELQAAYDNRGKDWDTFEKIAKEIGVTWNEAPNSNVNHMRCIMAVKDFMKNSLNQALNMATSKAKPKKKKYEPKKVVAITDKPSNPSKPDKRPDTAVKKVSGRYALLENAMKALTDDQKRICKVIGMVGTDEKSTEYITKKLWPLFEKESNGFLEKQKRELEQQKMKLESNKFKGIVNKDVQNWVDNVDSLIFAMFRDLNNFSSPHLDPSMQQTRMQNIVNNQINTALTMSLDDMIDPNELEHYKQQGASVDVALDPLVWDAFESYTPDKDIEEDYRNSNKILFETLGYLCNSSEYPEYSKDAPVIRDLYNELFEMLQKLEYKGVGSDYKTLGFRQRFLMRVIANLFNSGRLLADYNKSDESLFWDSAWVNLVSNNLESGPTPRPDSDKRKKYPNLVQDAINLTHMELFDKYANPKFKETFKEAQESLHLTSEDINDTKRYYSEKVTRYSIEHNGASKNSCRLFDSKAYGKLYELRLDSVIEYNKKSKEFRDTNHYNNRIGFTPEQDGILKNLSKHMRNLDDVMEYFGNIQRFKTRYFSTKQKSIVADNVDELMEWHSRFLKAAQSNEGRGVMANVYHMVGVTNGVNRSNWKNIYFDWENIDLMHLDDIMKIGLETNRKAGLHRDIQASMMFDITSLKPSLNKNRKKSAAEVKDKLNAAYQDRLDLLNGFNLDPSKLLDINAKVNTILTRVQDTEAKTIIRKINETWDKNEHGNMAPHVSDIFKIDGLPVEKEFQKVKAERGGTSGIYYHGTGTYTTTLILGKTGQFKVVPAKDAKVGRMLGDGIYLADRSSKSAQYIGERGFSRSLGTEGALMLVEAAFGKKTNIKDNPNADTVEAKISDPHWHVRNNEWCVRDARAVIPRYLIVMKLVNPKG